MIIMLIILSAILVFLRTRRQTPPPRRHIPQPKSHIPTYSPEQLRQARNDRRITTW